MKRGNNYIIHKDRQIAMIGKSGSSAIAKAIYIDGRDDVSEVMLLSNAPGFQNRVTQTQDAYRPMIPVRDPVERFRSACAQEDRTPSQEISRMERRRYSFHTKPTSAYLVEGATLYKFPEHLEKMAKDLGLDEIPKVNDSRSNNGPKPILTEEELEKVKQLYNTDIELFNSIENAGQTYS